MDASSSSYPNCVKRLIDVSKELSIISLISSVQFISKTNCVITYTNPSPKEKPIAPRAHVSYVPFPSFNAQPKDMPPKPMRMVVGKEKTVATIIVINKVAINMIDAYFTTYLYV